MSAAGSKPTTFSENVTVTLLVFPAPKFGVAIAIVAAGAVVSSTYIILLEGRALTASLSTSFAKAVIKYFPSPMTGSRASMLNELYSRYEFPFASVSTFLDMDPTTETNDSTSLETVSNAVPL